MDAQPYEDHPQDIVPDVDGYHMLPTRMLQRMAARGVEGAVAELRARAQRGAP